MTLVLRSTRWAVWLVSAFRVVNVVAAAALVLAGCAPALNDKVTLGGIEVQVHVADDAQERSRGLQGYHSLEAGTGMLFVFDSVAPRTFAMKEVSFPIDVVFFAEDNTVSAIEPLDPGDTRLVTSPGPSPYVIELPQAWAADHGIAVGSTLEVPE